MRTRLQCIPKLSVSVVAAILAAVEGGILPPDPAREQRVAPPFTRPDPPGRMPGSMAGRQFELLASWRFSGGVCNW
ncbi:MAG: hypothetical protein AAB676_02820, partial [Verrucomicrobiota bacterium]